MAQIIDGKKISQDIKDELKEKVTALKDTGTEVALAVIRSEMTRHPLSM